MIIGRIRSSVLRRGQRQALYLLLPPPQGTSRGRDLGMYQAAPVQLQVSEEALGELLDQLLGLALVLAQGLGPRLAQWARLAHRLAHPLAQRLVHRACLARRRGQRQDLRLELQAHQEHQEHQGHQADQHQRQLLRCWQSGGN